MDRATLEQLLSQGLSLAEIGRRSDLHEAAVGYWVKKHGLRAVNHDRHAAKGGLARAGLQPLVDAGMSIGEIARAVGRSRATVRHWLREYRLRTQRAERRHAAQQGQPELVLHCSHHGLTRFKRCNEGGYRCLKCRADAVSQRRRKVKQLLVADAGGACKVRGHDRSSRPSSSSSGASGEELRGQRAGRRAIFGEGTVGGEQVRAVVR